MKNLSRRNLMKGATAVSAAAALGTVTYTDIIAQDKIYPYGEIKNAIYIGVTDQINHPHFGTSDTLVIDISVNRFEGTGWYLWGNKVWRVEMSSVPYHDFVCCYQVRGEMWEMPTDDFKPAGRVAGRMRTYG